MLWEQYVFRRGAEVFDLWDSLLVGKPRSILYIAGGGFDLRAQAVMRSYVQSVSKSSIEKAELLLISLSGYELSPELKTLTDENSVELERIFSAIGTCKRVGFGESAAGEEDISANNTLRMVSEEVLKHIENQTDIILDVSSLPRVVYLTLLTSLLQHVVPDKASPSALFESGVNLQILVAEDFSLDGSIRSEDPSKDLVIIPGYSSALHAESFRDRPLIWFPILGENRMDQLVKVMSSEIPDNAEICPILPHPSRDPRRADRLMVAYKPYLFDKGGTPSSNVLYVHEANPFEAYRQLFTAMERYRESMRILGGCRLVVTPFGSKLITLGAGLACFAMKPTNIDEDYGVAIPYSEPTRYSASVDVIRASRPEISTLLLTGDAYSLDLV